MSGHSRSPGFVPGGYWAVCDRCAFDHRASTMQLEWNGAFVCKDCWEPRHPQDFVRGKTDSIAPRGPIRPEQELVFTRTDVEGTTVTGPIVPIIDMGSSGVAGSTISYHGLETMPDANLSRKDNWDGTWTMEGGAIRVPAASGTFTSLYDNVRGGLNSVYRWTIEFADWTHTSGTFAIDDNEVGTDWWAVDASTISPYTRYTGVYTYPSATYGASRFQLTSLSGGAGSIVYFSVIQMYDTTINRVTA